MTWWMVAQVAAAHVLTGLGGAVVLWAFIRERLRGGHALRRCPIWWFDLSGSAGCTCPECGHTERFELGLHRRRGRRRLVVVGVVLVLVGCMIEVRSWDSAASIRLIPLRLRVELIAWSGAPGDGWLAADLRGADAAL